MQSRPSAGISPSAWHLARRRAILASDPALRQLARPNPWTAACVAALVALQIGLAYALRAAPWYALITAAWFVGAFVVHALGVLIHECTHNLVLRSTQANKAVALLANVPLVLPGAIDFRDKHIAHHRHLGEGREVDFQTPPEEARAWTGTSPWRKLFWLVFGSFFSARSLRAESGRPDPWLRVNVVTQVAATAVLFAAAGPRALVYLLLSGLFAFGPHSVSIRGYAEHFDQRPGQPTNSYYGVLNLVSFNVGYHVEHHDLPGVPWNRLPELRRRAAPFYEDLEPTRSWGDLLVRFVVEADVGLHRYVVAGEPAARRDEAAKVRGSCAPGGDDHDDDLCDPRGPRRDGRLPRSRGRSARELLRAPCSN